MTPASDSVEAYRTAYLRLRLLLLGDGIDMPGLVRGEESRLRVTAELRHMRDVFHAGVVEDKEGRAEKAEARVVNLEEELRKIASFRAHAQQMRTDAIPVLLTPAESAKALRLSVSSIYRAVRDGEIRAVRLTNKRGGALRIPASEIQRRLEAAPLVED